MAREAAEYMGQSDRTMGWDCPETRRSIADDPANELALNTNANPIASKRGPGQELKKVISKALCHLSDQSSCDDASLLEGDDSQSSHAPSRDISLDTVLSYRVEDGAFKELRKRGRLAELHQKTY